MRGEHHGGIGFYRRLEACPTILGVLAAKLVDQGFLPPRMLPYYVNRAAASGVGE